MSVGYYKQHSKAEYLVIEEYEHVNSIIQRLHDEITGEYKVKERYVYKKTTTTSNSSPYTHHQSDFYKNNRWDSRLGVYVPTDEKLKREQDERNAKKKEDIQKAMECVNEIEEKRKEIEQEKSCQHGYYSSEDGWKEKRFFPMTRTPIEEVQDEEDEVEDITLDLTDYGEKEECSVCRMNEEKLVYIKMLDDVICAVCYQDLTEELMGIAKEDFEAL